MIELALLFIIIIVLLFVVIFLLQRFFDAYENVHGASDQSGETIEIKNDTTRMNEEMNNLMQQQEAAMEAHFPPAESEEGASTPKPEVLLQSLKTYLQSILKLLKVE